MELNFQHIPCNILHLTFTLVLSCITLENTSIKVKKASNKKIA